MHDIKINQFNIIKKSMHVQFNDQLALQSQKKKRLRLIELNLDSWIDTLTIYNIIKNAFRMRMSHFIENIQHNKMKNPLKPLYS